MTSAQRTLAAAAGSQRRWKAPAPAILCTAAYLGLVSAPLLLLLVDPVPQGGGYWRDFSMALGFAGMGIIGLQFALTLRFRHAAAPLGTDIVYCFHRYVAMLGFALLVLHWVILRVDQPAALGPLHPARAPAHLTAGRLSLALLTVVMATSLWRRQLRIRYGPWRIGHAVLSTAALLLGMAHISGVDYYSAALWHGWLWPAFAGVCGCLVVYVRLLRPWRLRRTPYRVVEVRPERARAWTVAVEPHGHGGLRFAPGQFAWLTLRASPFAFREHPFSFASSAEHPARLEFTIKELGDFTSTIGSVRAGETAYVDGPHGVFTIDRYPQAREFLFVAGGIGIAPIISMLRTLADRGDPRRVVLVYANVTWSDVVLDDDLQRLRGRLRLELVHVLEHPPAGWTGATGRITQDLLRDVLPADRHSLHCFLCGPRAMSVAVQAALHALGVPMTRVHYELFEMV